MCGIAGMICITPTRCAEDHTRVVGRMCAVQRYRGPDDMGVQDSGKVCLGSVRLSIIDLSVAGHMPMSDEAGWSIAYNGEVYNFQDVREELLRLGHVFKSRTDTEVVLRAFREWGPACLERLRGMFAFAVYDSASDTVTLVRDRFGKKPVYYMYGDGHILFASELKALADACARPEPNFQRLAEWSLFRNVDFGSSDTLFAGIHSLPPGHYMEIRGGKLQPPRRYFAPEAQISATRYEELARLSSQDLVANIRSLLTQSVRDRLVADVTVGTLCSGGIDSSLITAIAAQEHPDVQAFNVAVGGQGAVDESVYAEKVAKNLGIRLHSCRADGNVFRNTLVRAIYHSDHPLTHPNSVMFLKVSELARSHGVIVLLSGEAADELFGGYMQRYRRYGQLRRLESWLDRLPPKARRAIMLAGLACARVPVTEFSEYDGLLAHTTSFLDRFTRLELRARCARAYSFVADQTDREVLGAMLADVTNFLTPLLRRLDRMTMAASVECRAPFLDDRLVSLVTNVPLSMRLKGRADKWILKTIAAEYLPREIVYRKKVGFPLPLADYLAPFATTTLFEEGFCVQVLGMQRDGLKEALGDWRRNVHGFFNLLALEIWGRLFFFRQSVDEVDEQLRHVPGGPPRAVGTRRAA